MKKIPQPIKQVLANSTLYTGKDAIDKLQAMMAGGDSVTPIIVHIASPMRGRLRFLVTVRNIDTYKDRIEVYTNVGMLSLYADIPIPLTGEVIEAIEISNKIKV